MKAIGCAAALLLTALAGDLRALQNEAAPRTTEEVLFAMDPKKVHRVVTGTAVDTKAGTRTLWLAPSGSLNQVFIDDQPIGRFSEFSLTWIGITKAGQLFYIVPGDKNNRNLVIDNEVRFTFPSREAAGTVFDPAGEFMAVRLKSLSNGKWYWLVRGAPESEFDTVSTMFVSGDYRHHAYIATDKPLRLRHPMTGRIVRDGKPGPAYEAASGGGEEFAFRDSHVEVAHSMGVGEPVFSADGQRFGYAVHRGRNDESVTMDGAFGPSFEAIAYGPFLSEGDRHFAYAALKDNGRTLLEVRDHQVSREYKLTEPVFFGQGAFSQDLTHFAFIYGGLGPAPPGDLLHRHVVVDGKEQAEIECSFIGTPRFSPDGRHVAYPVLLEHERKPMQYLAIDGRPGKLYDFVFMGGFTYPDEHTVQYIAVDGLRFLRVTTRLD